MILYCATYTLIKTGYCLFQVLEKFLLEFFDQNPISQVQCMGINLGMGMGMGHILCYLCSSLTAWCDPNEEWKSGETHRTEWSVHVTSRICQLRQCHISSGNPQLHLKALDQVVTCSGDPSLQNALEMATRALR